MSYCRWSTPNCDLYCYEGEGGYTTHVAEYRHRLWYKFVRWMTDIRIPTAKHKIRVQRFYFYRLPHWAIHKKIGLPHDGESFADATIPELINTIGMLKSAGYKVPDFVLETLHEEMQSKEH